MALSARDPALRLQKLLQSDFRTEVLLKELTFSVNDEAYLTGDPGAGLPSIFEGLMSKREREANQRKKLRAGAIAAVRAVLRTTALPQPAWRWRGMGFSPKSLARHQLLQGRALLRSVTIGVIWLARLRLAAVRRGHALAVVESTDQYNALGVHSELAVAWASAALAPVTDGLWDAALQLDVRAAPSAREWAAARGVADQRRVAAGEPPRESTLLRALGWWGGAASRDASLVADARSAALHGKVKEVLDALGEALGAHAPAHPPLALRAFWARLTTDGFYFPPFHLTLPERGWVSVGPTGASRWMRPLRLNAPDRKADPMLGEKLSPDAAVHPGQLHPAWGGGGAGEGGGESGTAGIPRPSPVAPAFRYADEEARVRPPVSRGRAHSVVDAAPLHVWSWAGEDRGTIVYGSRAAGDFRRVEAVLTVTLILRAAIAGVLLDARPSPERVRRSHAAGVPLPEMLRHGRRNARVLASALYYLLGRILPGLLPGTLVPAALEGGWTAHTVERGREGGGGRAGGGAGESTRDAPSRPPPFKLTPVVSTPADEFEEGGWHAPRARLRRDSILRVDAHTGGVAAARPVPFERWVSSQVLPPSYFHARGRSETEGGGVRAGAHASPDATHVEVGEEGRELTAKDKAGLTVEGRVQPGVASSALQPWLEGEEAHLRMLMAGLSRYVLTYTGKPWRGAPHYRASGGGGHDGGDTVLHSRMTSEQASASAHGVDLDAAMDAELRALALHGEREDDGSVEDGAVDRVEEGARWVA